jgi:hypothetical protein
MKTPQLYSDDEWPYVLTLLPADLEETARRAGALVRQRNIPSAAALLRLALAYAVSDLSLKDVAAWASVLGVATITGPGLFYRMRVAERWLEQVLAATLEQQVGKAPDRVRLRVVDATVINGPRSEGTQWRAHVTIDPGTGGLQSVELTDAHRGEELGRHSFNPGEVVLGDRGYATARGVHSVRQAQAHVVVRPNPHTLRICDAGRSRISVLADADKVPKVGAMDYEIQIPVPPTTPSKSHKPWKLSSAVAWIPARIVASRTKDGTIIWLLTTLSKEHWPPHLILRLYRFRWQIELLFKRLKSILHLDTLPSRFGPTAKSWMLARFLAAAIVQRLTPPAGALSPWGYEIREQNAANA